ncbi:MAG TPA: type VI secretion system-associated protein TagF [Sandaracinaceae bacterium LLY-WYZ-13_1]|nr:type VI secretion system-associated protein TagF [Sandaracinaceae bacterium LLY-WYZ-13_1]
MPELGFFGKIPAKGDFVRHNVTDDAARSFEQWVQEAYDGLRGAGADLPAHPVRAVFTPPGSQRTVVATMVPSQDQVGRQYPLVIFALTDAGQTASHFSVMPVAWSPFLDAAVALAQRAAQMDLDAIEAALKAIPAPSGEELGRAQQMADQLLGHPLAPELHGRLFGDGSQMHFYAYQTFLTACEGATKNDPGKAATVLDCPIHVDVDLFVWLELARRVFGFPPAHPSYFWLEDPSPRLLLSLGSAPLGVLQFLAKPDMDNQRLWPLTTERDKAVEAARGTLEPALAQVGDDAPLRGWMETLAQRATGGTAR